MHVRLSLILSVIISLSLACSSTPTPEEKADAVEDEVKTETMAELKSDAHTLAACTDGAAVPKDAKNCLLDLGTGTDSYWSDTDGIDPAVAGCHVEYEDDQCSAALAERTFGELCLDADRLVESNPGKDECHTHAGDMGKPDVVSCSAWCTQQGNAGGGCEEVAEAVQGTVTCKSARCVCS